jgi:hypothetical protein
MLTCREIVYHLTGVVPFRANPIWLWRAAFRRCPSLIWC